MSFGGVELALDAIHVTADGRRLLVTHGDEFDGVVLYAPLARLSGDQAYTIPAAHQSLGQHVAPPVQACRTGRCRRI